MSKKIKKQTFNIAALVIAIIVFFSLMVMLIILIKKINGITKENQTTTVEALKEGELQNTNTLVNDYGYTEEEANIIVENAKSISMTYSLGERALEETNAFDEKEINIYKNISVIINGMSENVYLKVTDNQTKNTKTYDYSVSSEGTIIFDDVDTFNLVKYTVQIYTTDNNGNELEIRNFEYDLPKYNDFSETLFCEENANLNICQKLVWTDYTYEDFYKTVGEEDLSSYEVVDGDLSKLGESTQETTITSNENYEEITTTSQDETTQQEEDSNKESTNNVEDTNATEETKTSNFRTTLVTICTIAFITVIIITIVLCRKRRV